MRAAFSYADRHRPRHLRWLRHVTFPAVLWLAIWAAVNTGPGAIPMVFTDAHGTLHGLRALIPAGCAVLALAHAQSARRPTPLPGALRLWLLYGVIGLLACAVSPHPVRAAYWAVSYLSVFAALRAYIQGPDPLARCARLNRLTWIIATALLVTLILSARDVLFVDRGDGLSGYGVVTRTLFIGDTPMSRSSGMGRFAAIPGIVAVVWALSAQAWRRWLWIGVASASGALIYLMQSRGATLGFAFAAGLVMLLHGARSRRIGAGLLVLVALGILGELIPHSVIDDVSRHLLRDQRVENLETLTGRTHAWTRAWDPISRSPAWGWGPQADRYILGEHAHNTYVYAALQAGGVGVALFVVGLAWGWVAFVRVLRCSVGRTLADWRTFLAAGGVLAFFTARSIPEVSGAMFGVDELVMLPALAYVTLLERERVRRLRGRPRRSGLAASAARAGGR